MNGTDSNNATEAQATLSHVMTELACGANGTAPMVPNNGTLTLCVEGGQYEDHARTNHSMEIDRFTVYDETTCGSDWRVVGDGTATKIEQLIVLPRNNSDIKTLAVENLMFDTLFASVPRKILLSRVSSWRSSGNAVIGADQLIVESSKVYDLDAARGVFDRDAPILMLVVRDSAIGVFNESSWYMFQHSNPVEMLGIHNSTIEAQSVSLYAGTATIRNTRIRVSKDLDLHSPLLWLDGVDVSEGMTGTLEMGGNDVSLTNSFFDKIDVGVASDIGSLKAFNTTIVLKKGGGDIWYSDKLDVYGTLLSANLTIDCEGNETPIECRNATSGLRTDEKFSCIVDKDKEAIELRNCRVSDCRIMGKVDSGDGLSCKDCAPNEIAINGTVCQACRNGTFASPYGSLCVACEADEFYDLAERGCRACPEGRKPTGNGTACSSCGAGMYKHEGLLTGEDYYCAECNAIAFEQVFKTKECDFSNVLPILIPAAVAALALCCLVILAVVQQKKKKEKFHNEAFMREPLIGN